MFEVLEPFSLSDLQIQKNQQTLAQVPSGRSQKFTSSKAEVVILPTLQTFPKFQVALKSARQVGGLVCGPVCWAIIPIPCGASRVSLQQACVSLPV